jgi:hypothetical protein
MGYFILGLAIVILTVTYTNYIIHKDDQDDTNSN